MLLFIIGAGFVRTSEQDYSLQTHAFLFLTKNISTLGLSGLANSLMKKIIFSLCMLMGTFCFSQTVTKKYNSYYNRYEYYDSSSNLIGYEKYNSYSGRWEYYSLKSPQQSRQPYQYKDPQELDISNLGNAATTLQNRYNNNQKNAQSVVDDILYQIKSLNISDDRKNRIIESFNKTVINNMESLYRGNVSWLYDAANTIIKNTN